MLATLGFVELLILVPLVAAFVLGTRDVFTNGSGAQRRIAGVLLGVASLLAIGIWIGAR